MCIQRSPRVYARIPNVRIVSGCLFPPLNNTLFHGLRERFGGGEASTYRGCGGAIGRHQTPQLGAPLGATIRCGWRSHWAPPYPRGWRIYRARQYGAVAGVPLCATIRRTWGRHWERPYAGGCHWAPPYAAVGGTIGCHHMLRMGTCYSFVPVGIDPDTTLSCNIIAVVILYILYWSAILLLSEFIPQKYSNSFSPLPWQNFSIVYKMWQNCIVQKKKDYARKLTLIIKLLNLGFVLCGNMSFNNVLKLWSWYLHNSWLPSWDKKTCSLFGFVKTSMF